MRRTEPNPKRPAGFDDALLRGVAHRAAARELRPERRGLQRLVHDHDVLALRPVTHLRSAVARIAAVIIEKPTVFAAMSDFACVKQNYMLYKYGPLNRPALPRRPPGIKT